MSVTELRLGHIVGETPGSGVLKAVDAAGADRVVVAADPATGKTIIRAIGTATSVGAVEMQDRDGNVQAVALHAATHGVNGSDALSFAASQITSGTVPVARGGTGLGAAGLPGTFLRSDGTVLTYASVAAGDVPGDLTGKGVVGSGALPAPALPGKLHVDTVLKRDTGVAWEAVPTEWTAIQNRPATFTPSAHTHPTSEVTGLLDQNGKIVSTLLPSLVVTDTHVVDGETAMLALKAQTGDVAVRTDLKKSFILKGASAATLADWQELLTPTDAVVSVNGYTGAVSLAAGDVGAIPTTQKAAANGVATLDASTRIPVAQIPPMVGATALAAGTLGAVPAPAAGDQDRVLHGDGGWRAVAAGVTSVFGRTGAVTAATGDYAFSQISGSLALSQIAPGGAAIGQVLKWNGTAWAPGTDDGGSSGASTGAENTWTATQHFSAAVGSRHVGTAVAADGGLSDSAVARFTGFYDADTTTAVASTAHNFDLRYTMTAGGASPAGALQFLSHTGSEMIRVTSGGALRIGVANAQNDERLRVGGAVFVDGETRAYGGLAVGTTSLGGYKLYVSGTSYFTEHLLTGGYVEVSNLAQPANPAAGKARAWWDDAAGALKVVNSAGTVTTLGSGGGAPTGASYVVLSADATLTGERVLAVGSALTLTDAGAGGSVTLDVSTVAPAKGGTGLTTVAKGGVLYASAADTWAALAGTTTDGHVLAWNNTTGLPEWRAAEGGTSTAYTVKATKNATQSVANATLTAVTFGGADEFDADSYHDPATNNTRILIGRKLGYWLVIGCVRWSGSVSGAQVRIFKNGGTTENFTSFQSALNSQVVAVVKAGATTDFIELYAYQSSGAAATIADDGSTTAGTYFTAHWIGA